MDPASHVLLGRALNCLDSRRRLGRGAAAACMLGSLAPDLDIVVVTRGWDVYLQYHQMGTHTLAAAPLLAGATAALIRVCVRGSVYSRLFIAALIGVIGGHVLFDLVSGSDIRLLAPLSFRVFGPHLLTMADLAAIAALLPGSLLSVWRRTAGGVLVVVALVALLVVKAISLQVASRTYEHTVTPPAAIVRSEAINGSLVRWRFYDRAGATVRAWLVDSWEGHNSMVFTRNMRVDADTNATRSVPAVRRFFAFAEIPFARVDDLSGMRRVLWSDVNACGANSCVMSFGAVLDDRGTPVCELIQVGDYVKMRPLASFGVASPSWCGS